MMGTSAAYGGSGPASVVKPKGIAVEKNSDTFGPKEAPGPIWPECVWGLNVPVWVWLAAPPVDPTE